jgi:hypothetical protein
VAHRRAAAAVGERGGAVTPPARWYPIKEQAAGKAWQMLQARPSTAPPPPPPPASPPVEVVEPQGHVQGHSPPQPLPGQRGWVPPQRRVQVAACAGRGR